MATTTARTSTPVHPPARSIHSQKHKILGLLIINFTEGIEAVRKGDAITYQVEAACSVDQAGGLAERMEVLGHFAL